MKNLGKEYSLNSAICSCENSKYAGSIGDSVVICDNFIEETKTIQTKNTSRNFYILLSFLLITMALLIAIIIYVIKQESKQKHLLPYHDRSKFLKKSITNIL